MVVLILLVLLLIVVGLVSTIPSLHRSVQNPSADQNVNQSANQPVQLPVAPAPPITKHMQDVVANSKGFSQFISYTDNGFEPADVTIKKGEAVRFTNNSSHNMWIMSSGGDGGMYPAAANSCGQTSFDTCVAFPPNEIWEFTFDVPGTWVYRNNVNKSDVGVIHVK